MPAAGGRDKDSEKFDPEILKHHVFHSRKAVCMHCVECGYSPLDVRSYHCQGNGGHPCGHQAFDRDVLKKLHRPDRTTKSQNLLCEACAKSTLHCCGCKTYLHQSSFSKDIWNHGSHDGRECVCIRCEAVGLSPHDAQRYVCNHCGKEYGHKKFDRISLKPFKTQGRTTKLCCRQCKTESTSSSPADRLRRKASATSTLPCIGCKTYVAQSSFSKDMWHNGRTREQ